MNRWVLLVVVGAAAVSLWRWGFTAALPYLGLIACGLMCLAMVFMHGKEAHGKTPVDKPEASRGGKDDGA